ncbi:hypothetical protein WBP07_14985 [Novosphingobium sp. BL-8A]|uniref:DUF3617 domain-containing protein n=1 Tax=Novosphingobium sp. BL-8A TaxID=3127639 RepID=UPI00375678C5
MDKADGLVSKSRGAPFSGRMLRAALFGLTSIGLAAMPWPGVAQKKPLAMLDQLDRGSWELRGLGNAGKLCLRSGHELIQLKHPGMACTTVIVDDTINEVTVQYTCPGQGYGRTHIRRETGNLIQIDSQGIANGRPFVFATEGRRVGNCGG